MKTPREVGVAAVEDRGAAARRSVRATLDVVETSAPSYHARRSRFPTHALARAGLGEASSALFGGMARARGVVAHGAAFSKHFAACTLTADDGTHDAAAVVDVVLAAKDGWGVETLAELCAALRLPRDPDDPPPSSSRTEVEIIESIPETLDDADRPGATCLHPLTIRARRCATADWRTWRAVPPTDAPPRANPVPADAPPTRAPSGANPRANWRKRKNDNRASAFAALLVREFGRDRLRAGAGVVDVAGGSGELAFELAARWGSPCPIIDPRGEGVRVTARHRRLLASRAANAALVPPAWIASSPLASQLSAQWSTFHPARTSHVKRPFDASAMDDPKLAALLLECSAIVGLHPDQATGAVVDAGLTLNKPWATVPCCVFPGSFPERKAPTTGRTARTTEELVEHLAARMANGRARREVLHFDGANVAVWCDAEPGRGTAKVGRTDFPWPTPPPPNERAAGGPFQLRSETRARASAADDA